MSSEKVMSSEKTSAEESSITPQQSVTTAQIRDWLTAVIAKQMEVGVEEIDSTISIMSYGLESLTLFTLTGDLASWLDYEIPTTLFWDYQTIDAVAVYLGQQQEQPDEPLAPRNSNIVTLQPNGDKTPLFLIHPYGGHVWCYSTLAKHLGEDRPIYGFLLSDEVQLQSMSSIEELASVYVRELREFYPQGPYLLGGLSMGGVIAFEMSQQLRAQGHEPALLALFDSRCPGTRPNHSMHRKVRIHLRNLRQLSYSQMQDYVFGRVKMKAKRQLQESKLAHLLTADKSGEATPQTRHSELKETTEQLIHINNAYVPKQYAGPITLLRAKIHFSNLGDRMGWDTVAKGGLKQYFISGTHTSIIEEPNVRQFAACLNQCLNEAQNPPV